MNVGISATLSLDTLLRYRWWTYPLPTVRIRQSPVGLFWAPLNDVRWKICGLCIVDIVFVLGEWSASWFEVNEDVGIVATLEREWTT